MSSGDESVSGSDGEEISSSVLGTKSYWDQQYVTELENFQNHGDIGEIWFGKKVMQVVVEWVSTKFEHDTEIMDLGCGNGAVLLQLAKKGFKKLTGVDYAESAVILAKSIAESNQVNIIFETMDILSDTAVNNGNGKKYKVLLDKGTFDAISLMENFGSSMRERYLKTTDNLLEDDGFFLIVTCNWTTDEIVQHMASHYTSPSVLPTPSFQFGGKEGNKSEWTSEGAHSK